MYIHNIKLHATYVPTRYSSLPQKLRCELNMPQRLHRSIQPAIQNCPDLHRKVKSVEWVNWLACNVLWLQYVIPSTPKRISSSPRRRKSTVSKSASEFRDRSISIAEAHLAHSWVITTYNMYIYLVIHPHSLLSDRPPSPLFGVVTSKSGPKPYSDGWPLLKTIIKVNTFHVYCGLPPRLCLFYAVTQRNVICILYTVIQ